MPIAAAENNMAQVTNTVVLGALKRYFKTLMSTGYSKCCDYKRLLVCLLILDILSDKMNIYLTDRAYTLLARIYRKFTGDCLLPYDAYCKSRNTVGGSTVGTLPGRNDPKFRILLAQGLIAVTEEED